MFKKYFLIIFFLIFPSHAGFFELEIEALLMVMKNKEIISTKKYKEALMHLMVLQKDKREYGYNELTLDSVRPLAIYLKKQISTPDVVDKIRSVREYSRLPIKLNVKEADIDRITKKMR